MKNLNEIPIPDEHEVYWEPWIDAYNTDEIVGNIERIIEQKFLDKDDIEDELIEELDLEEEDFKFFSQPVKTIMTPFGVLPLTENTLASTHFKFWVGHSNFKLLDEYYPIIEKCSGVESVDILTPYRFRIAVGKLFRDRDVMGDVRRCLIKTVKKDELEK